MHNKNSSTTPIKRQRLLHTQWLEHFSAWNTSGQTQQAYCLSQNFSLQAFKKHYARYRNQLKNKMLQASEPLFIPVQLTDTAESEHMEFIFRSGVILKIPSSVSLKTTLESLEPYL